MPENDSRPLPRWGDTNSFAGPSDILRTRATSPRPLADYQPLLFPETDRHEPPPRQPAPIDEQTAEADGPPDNQQPDAQADRSTSLVTNIDSAVWPDYLDDPPLAMALMDRVVDGAIPLNIQGKSYDDPSRGKDRGLSVLHDGPGGR